MYITIVLVALIAGATVVACKYLNYGTSLETAQSEQLNSISTIASKLKDRYYAAYVDESKKYELLPTENMIRDAIDEIYEISITNYVK